MAKLILTIDKVSERELEARASKQKPSEPPMELTPQERAILFLRGLGSRVGLALSAFYLFLGSRSGNDNDCCVDGYPGVVLKHSIEFSSISTISLVCRKAFDHKITGLTGANFAKCSDETIEYVTKYWTESSGRPVSDANAALSLLRSIFQDCAKTDSALLSNSKSSVLGRRIGLLKQYANRSAAHLSMENYEFTILDCAHVVASLSLIGEIIRSFDDPNADPSYYDNLDEASLSAAKELFPAMPDIRLFKEIEVEVQARTCWQWGIDRGRHMLLEQLPYAIGWFK